MTELDDRIRALRNRNSTATRAAGEMIRYGSPAYRAVTPDPKVSALVRDFTGRLRSTAGASGYFWVETDAGRTVHLRHPKPRGGGSGRRERRAAWKQHEHNREADSRGDARLLTIGDSYQQWLYHFVCIEGRWSPAEELTPGGNRWLTVGQTSGSLSMLERYMAEYLGHS